MSLHDSHVPLGSRPEAVAAFPIVGIGASAGGLEALETLTRRLATDSMSFVVLPHEAPSGGRPLIEVLARDSTLPVVAICDGTSVAANHIYVTPPGAELAIQRGVLRLAPQRSRAWAARPSIDGFFHTLAAELGNRAVGVLLSRAGDDGTAGLQAIKDADGITFVQRPATASQPGMLQSALEAGVADFALDAGDIADELTRLSRHPYLAARRQQRLDDETRRKLFIRLRSEFAVDFGGYRPTTIERRIHRRMVLHKLDRGDDYLRHVEGHPDELGVLYSELLFCVTGFFNHPAQFDALTSQVFPMLTADRAPGAPLRIWVVGCATGEEAYSIAICLREYLDERALGCPVQIFASDIDDRAIARARQGLYPSSIERQLSPQRLLRFFIPAEGGFQIKRTIRDMVVFARHNVAEDPPFSRIDLVSCRNVLAALQPAVQSKVSRALHFALRPDAFLLLGTDESAGAESELFGPIDLATRLYAKRPVATNSVELRGRAERWPARPEPALPGDLETENHALRESHARIDASRSRYADLYDFAPVAYCTLDRAGVVLEINLAAAALIGADRTAIVGRPLAALVRLDDTAALAAHLGTALAASAPCTGEISFSSPRGPCIVQLISAPARRQLGPPTICRTVMIDITEQRVAERQTSAMHASEQLLRRRIERLECASAQVTAALATLPASNQRALLQMVVDQARILTDAELAALGVGGGDGRRFDPWVVSGVTAEQAAAIGRAPRSIGVLDAVVHSHRPLRLRDVGEHVRFLGLPLHHPMITSFLAIPIRYLGDHFGNLYVANKCDGGEFSEDDQMAIEMFAERVGVALEIARLRQVEVREYARLDLLARAGPLLAEPLEYTTTLAAVARLVVPVIADLSAIDLVHDDGSVTEVVGYHCERRKQRLLDRLCGACEADRVPGELRAAIVSGEVQLCDAPPAFLRGGLDEAEYGALVQEIGATCAILAPLVVRGRVVGVLRLAMAESGRRYAPHDVELAREIAQHAAVAIERARLYRAAQVAVDARDDLLAFVTHDLHNYLATIRVSADALIVRDTTAPSKTGKQLDLLARTVTHMSRLIEGLRDATMIDSGQFTVTTAPHDVAALVADAIETLAPQAEAKSLELSAQIDDALPEVVCDRDRVLQVIANLVGNAIKFTPARGAIRLRATREDGAVRISIRDTGAGIAENELPLIFDRHWKGDATGTGLGLFIARGIVQMHGGRIWAESAPRVGSTFHFTLPIAPAASNGDARAAQPASPAR